jgi:hypothetical protein
MTPAERDVFLESAKAAIAAGTAFYPWVVEQPEEYEHELKYVWSDALDAVKKPTAEAVKPVAAKPAKKPAPSKPAKPVAKPAPKPKPDVDMSGTREQISRQLNKKDPTQPVLIDPSERPAPGPKTDFLPVAPSPEQFNLTMHELREYVIGAIGIEAAVNKVSGSFDDPDADFTTGWDDDPIEASRERDEMTAEILAAMKKIRLERPLRFRRFFVEADQRIEYERVRGVEEDGSGTGRRRKKAKFPVPPHFGQEHGFFSASRVIVDKFLKFLPLTAQAALFFCYRRLDQGDGSLDAMAKKEGRFVVSHKQVSEALGFPDYKVGRRAMACLCRAGIIRLLHLGRPGQGSEYLFLEPDDLHPREVEEKVREWRQRPGNGGKRPGAGRPKGSRNRYSSMG